MEGGGSNVSGSSNNRQRNKGKGKVGDEGASGKVPVYNIPSEDSHRNSRHGQERFPYDDRGSETVNFDGGIIHHHVIELEDQACEIKELKRRLDALIKSAQYNVLNR